jgi:hypothetical protein
MVCRDMGRHVHIDFCRSNDPATCSAAGLEHLNKRLQPRPDEEKDQISHRLYWQRLSKYQAFLAEYGLTKITKLLPAFKGIHPEAAFMKEKLSLYIRSVFSKRSK